MKSGRLLLVIVTSFVAVAVILSALYIRRMLIRRSRGRFPHGIVIHHTATPPFVHGRPVSVAAIDLAHALRGFYILDPRTGTAYHIGYHFLVLQDGTIRRGRPEYLSGAHTAGHPDMLGIALVGNFEPASNRGRMGPAAPPEAQIRAVEWLTRMLMAKYRLGIRQVYLHRDLCPTACPGSNFPRARFFHALHP